MSKKELKEWSESDNVDFVQVSRQYLKNWRGLIRKNAVAAEILMFLVEKMGKPSNAVICSYQTLQEVTDVSRTTVSKAIKHLKENNWIQLVKVGNASAYCVNEKVVWQSARNLRKYAVFSATVVASDSEQNIEYIEDKTPLKHIPIVDSNDRISINEKEKLPPPDQQDLPLN